MDMQQRIDAYWSKRAKEFSDARLVDLKSDQKEVWIQIIKENLPEKTKITALDLGTGAGFYAFLLADLGCNAFGIDYSKNMIEQAINNSRVLNYDINFTQMDAQALQFQDNTFDFIISRNVTWTLPDPEQAYKEISRVLKPGGRFLNFDANYGQAFKAADEAGITEQQRDWSRGPYKHPAQSMEMIRERNDIAKSLYICDCVRPQWDTDIFLKNGITKIWIDTNISKRIYGEEKMYGNQFDTGREDDSGKALPTSPLFMICAEK